MRVVLMKARRAGFTRYMGKLMEVLSRRREIPDWAPVLPKRSFDRRFRLTPVVPAAAFSYRAMHVVSTGRWRTLSFASHLQKEIKFAVDPGSDLNRMAREMADSYKQDLEAWLCGSNS